MMTFLKALIDRIRGRPRPDPVPEMPAIPGAESVPVPIPTCAWCERPVAPGDHYMDLADGEAVHKTCRHATVDEKTWFSVRRVLVDVLRPACLALGGTKEAQDLVFRLYPLNGVSLENAFSVVFELERRVRELAVHDFRTSAGALQAIRDAQRELRAFLPAA